MQQWFFIYKISSK